MAKFSLDPTDGQTVKNIRLGGVQHTLHIDPQGATGTLTVEADPGRDDNWQAVPFEFDLASPGVYSFTGPVARYRFTLSGVTGSNPIIVEDAGGKVAKQGQGYAPSEVGFDPGYLSGDRLQVDVGSFGFFDGRTFRISYEFSTEQGNSVPNNGTRWVRFTAGEPFILQLQRLTVDDGAIRFRVFRDGVGSGTWTPVLVSRLNVVNNTYTPQVTVDDGGSVDTTGEDATETIRVRTAGATAQANTITANASDERYLPAGVYYLQLENIAGSGAASGVLDLQWEDRPIALFPEDQP